MSWLSTIYLGGAALTAFICLYLLIKDDVVESQEYVQAVIIVALWPIFLLAAVVYAISDNVKGKFL